MHQRYLVIIIGISQQQQQQQKASGKELPPFSLRNQSIEENKLLYNQLKKDHKLLRIVFFLTLSRRDFRQSLRLLNSIYDEHHYYYVHVDAKSIYLGLKLRQMLNETMLSNVIIADWSIEAIWLGPSLMDVHFRAFSELISLKRQGIWNWDYVINLSESDYPIAPMEEFTLYLRENYGMNFIGVFFINVMFVVLDSFFLGFFYYKLLFNINYEFFL